MRNMVLLFLVSACAVVLIVLYKSNQNLKLAQRLRKIQEEKLINPKDFKPIIENNTIVVNQKNIIFSRFEYKKTFEPETKLNIQKYNPTRKNSLVFLVEPITRQCKSIKDTDCINFLSKATAEFNNYGGIWRFDIANKQFKHLLKIPQEDKSNVTIGSYLYKPANDSVTVIFNIKSQYGEEKIIRFNVDVQKETVKKDTL